MPLNLYICVLKKVFVLLYNRMKFVVCAHIYIIFHIFETLSFNISFVFIDNHQYDHTSILCNVLTYLFVFFIRSWCIENKEQKLDRNHTKSDLMILFSSRKRNNTSSETSYHNLVVGGWAVGLTGSDAHTVSSWWHDINLFMVALR